MKKMNLIRMALAISTILGSTTAFADESGENVIYFGAGPAKSSNSFNNSGDNSLSLGYLRLSNSSDMVWGVDFSGEGTMRDSTGNNYNTVQQATSFNFLIGRNLIRNESSRFDTALIVGMREKTSECPKSYLGYQCYADTDPNKSYGLNYGLALTWTYKSVMLGVRATGESTQALLGLRF
jgi:hypothetical protein